MTSEKLKLLLTEVEYISYLKLSTKRLIDYDDADIQLYIYANNLLNFGSLSNTKKQY